MFYKALDTNWQAIASSGGIVRGCADWLLKNGHINKIIGVLQGDTPGEFYWGVTDDPAQLAKSVYKPLEYKPLLDRLTEKEKQEALFIGIPCQVAAGVKYRITLFCSGHTKGDQTKVITDFRFGHKPYNFGIQYADGTFDRSSNVKIGNFKDSCKTCKLPYQGDMIVGDLHGTPFNLVKTLNPLFDEYIRTTQHRTITEAIFSILKADS